MKIRTAFVSNSSSSACITLIPKKIHNEVLEQLNEKDRDALNCTSKKYLKEKMLFGMEMLVTESTSDCCGVEQYNQKLVKQWSKKYPHEDEYHFDDYVVDAEENYYNILRKKYKDYYFHWDIEF